MTAMKAAMEMALSKTASAYLTASPAGAAMAKWCREHGFEFAVKPGSTDGLADLVVKTPDGDVYVPFVAGDSKVERAVETVEEMVTSPGKGEPDLPQPPEGYRNDVHWKLRTQEEREFQLKRARYVLRAFEAGVARFEIVRRLMDNGTRLSPVSVDRIIADGHAGLRKRKQDVVKPKLATGGKPPKAKGGDVVDITAKRGAVVADRGTMHRAVMKLMREARSEGADAADEMARSMVKEILAARKQVELEMIEQDIDQRIAKSVFGGGA